jgi:hypothetical protein
MLFEQLLPRPIFPCFLFACLSVFSLFLSSHKRVSQRSSCKNKERGFKKKKKLASKTNLNHLRDFHSQLDKLLLQSTFARKTYSDPQEELQRHKQTFRESFVIASNLNQQIGSSRFTKSSRKSKTERLFLATEIKAFYGKDHVESFVDSNLNKIKTGHYFETKQKKNLQDRLVSMSIRPVPCWKVQILRHIRFPNKMSNLFSF